MSDTVQASDKDDIIKNEEELNKAFSAGFNDDAFKIIEEVKTDIEDDGDIKNNKIESEEITDVKNESIEKNEEIEKTTSENEKTDTVDEWEGVPQAIRSRFEKLNSELDRVTNIANAASGQARKLQNRVEKQDESKPQPTSEQIRAAMTDKNKREELRTDWGNFAAAMDEADDRVAVAVGDAIDKLKVEIFEHTNKSQAAFEMQRSLDINHPGWETTVLKAEFKNWLYEDGPAIDERDTYERTLSYAQSLHGNSPSESSALYAEANNYYSRLLEKYPIWARERGTLYGDQSGKAAMELLDMYKKNNTVAEDQKKIEKVAFLAKNKQRLEENLTPTSGKSAKGPSEDIEDVQAAFSAGFHGRP